MKSIFKVIYVRDNYVIVVNKDGHALKIDNSREQYKTGDTIEVIVEDEGKTINYDFELYGIKPLEKLDYPMTLFYISEYYASDLITLRQFFSDRVARHVAELATNANSD